MQVWRGSLSIFDQELHPRQPRQLLVVPDRAVPVPDSLASGAVVDLGQWRATGFQQASSALAQYAAGGCVYRRFAVVVKAVDGMASCACSLSIPRLFSPARVFCSGCTRERSGGMRRRIKAA